MASADVKDLIDNDDNPFRDDKKTVSAIRTPGDRPAYALKQTKPDGEFERVFRQGGYIKKRGPADVGSLVRPSVPVCAVAAATPAVMGPAGSGPNAAPVRRSRAAGPSRIPVAKARRTGTASKKPVAPAAVPIPTIVVTPPTPEKASAVAARARIPYETEARWLGHDWDGHGLHPRCSVAAMIWHEEMLQLPEVLEEDENDDQVAKRPDIHLWDLLPEETRDLISDRQAQWRNLRDAMSLATML